MMRSLLPLLAAAALVIPVFSQAANVSWTGTEESSWDTSENWSPEGIPTSADDITVSSGGSVVIAGGSTASAQSLTIAGSVEVGSFSGNGEVLVVGQGVTLQNGGRLTGLGTIQSDITVQAGGQFAPGSIYDVGSLAVIGNVGFQNGSIAVFSIPAPNVLNGSLSIDGNLTLNGLLSLSSTAELGVYTLINFTGDLAGTFSGVVDTVAGYDYELIYTANSVELTVTTASPVPEPSTYAALAGFAVLGSAKIRRRRKTA